MVKEVVEVPDKNQMVLHNNQKQVAMDSAAGRFGITR